MEFGLFMMPLHPPHRAFADGYERDVAQIVLADQLGFREAWVGEHLTERWENAPAPDLLLAQVLDVVLKLWASEGRFTYRGKFFDIETPVFDPVKDRGYYMKPYQLPHPPIAVAASTPNSGSMRMAGERGWIPMSSSLLSRPYLADHWHLVEAGAASAGRQADRSQWRIARDVLVAPTSSVARERARIVLGRNYVQHQYPNRVGTAQMALTKLEPSMPDEAVTVDYLMENVWIVGDPSECVDKIQQLYDESGGFGALLSITTDSDDAGWDHESLRLLMDRVAPRVAHLG